MSSLVIDSRFICTRTTGSFTSARQSTTPRLLSISRQHASFQADFHLEACLKASRLCLNPAKTQVMWPGSQLLARLDNGRRARLVIQRTGPGDGS